MKLVFKKACDVELRDRILAPNHEWCKVNYILPSGADLIVLGMASGCGQGYALTYKETSIVGVLKEEGDRIGS